MQERKTTKKNGSAQKKKIKPQELKNALEWGYLNQLQKSIYQEVEVEMYNGEKVRGTLFAIHPQHLNVVIKTEKDAVYIKNILRVTRVRDQTPGVQK